jgi:O-antigen/teichoic acid export membrane protein
MLAYGYVLASVVGIYYYAVAVFRELRREGLLRIDLLEGLRMPVRTILSYSVPAMAADWGSVFMAASGPLILGYLADMSTVALYQVVVPVAAMNDLVSKSFATLFEPSASRLIARGDPIGLNRLYWRSAVWVAVLTFPLFAVSFAGAEPLINLLYGERYVAAAPILSLLALAQFIDHSIGFSGHVLRVGGHLHLLIGANVAAAVTNIGVSIWLIPSMGALGAGVGAAAGYVVYTVLRQAEMTFASSVSAFDASHRTAYLTIVVSILGLVALRYLWPGSPWLLVSGAGIASVAVVASARVSLSVIDTFPELARWPFLKTLLG